MYLVSHRGFSGVVQALAAAITRQENVNPTYNNPGALIAAPGCTSRAGAIAICPDAATGEAGLERQIQLYIDRGLSISDMMAKWAPKCDQPICAGNDSATYAANVSSWTGYDSSVPMSSLISGASNESGAPGPDFFNSFVGSDSFFSDLDPWTVGIAAGIVILAMVVARG